MKRNWLSDISYLLYPKICAGCEANTSPGDELFCLECDLLVSPTQMHLQQTNEFTERLYGRLQFFTGAAMYRSPPGGVIRTVLHKIKYRGYRTMAYNFGQRYGHRLKKSQFFSSTQVIVPVPLHRTRKRIRGFNQVLEIAKGLHATTDWEISTDNLIRIRATASQTKMNKIGRITNLENAFTVKDPEKLEGKDVLLIDDIFTTGSTLEACGLELNKVDGIKLRLATIALAV